jgi:hypothetical protein
VPPTARAPQQREREQEAAVGDPVLDPTDPAARLAAQLAPRLDLVGGIPAVEATTCQVPGADEVLPRARVSMEELLPQLVRRIAWAGDRHRGTVQLELGAGPHAGTVVTVHAAEGRVSVALHGAGDVGALRDRIDDRLRAIGIQVDAVT